MAARRTLSWVSALRDIKDDRAKRADVRCEPVRAYTRGIELCTWRGRSGRRYVFRILPADAVDATDLRDCVVVGATVDRLLVGAVAHCTMDAVAFLIESGATHIHLHSLTDSAAERADVARDLRPLVMEAA